MKTKLISILTVICIVTMSFSALSINAFESGEISISLKQNGDIVLAELFGQESGGVLIISQYEDSGELCQTNKYTIGNGETYASNVNALTKTVRAVWVKSIKSLKPICKPDQITITKDDTIIDVLNIEPNFNIEKYGYVEYYESATSTKTKRTYISCDEYYNQIAQTYVNGRLVGSFDMGYESAYNCADATVSFTDTDGDNYADIINFTAYDYYTVAEIETRRKRIAFDGNNGCTWVSFADLLEDKELTISFKNAQGDDISIDDFRLGDVVAVASKSLGKVRPSSANNVVTYYNLGNNKLKGTITELNIFKNTVCINGTEYKVAGCEVGKDEGFSFGDKGTYILTKTGKVCMYQENMSDYAYAYVLTAAETEGGVDASTVQFKLLTSDQGIITVDANTVFEYVKANGESIESKIPYLGNEIEAFYQADGMATVKDRLVKYQLTTDNKLRSIIAFDSINAITLGAGTKYYPELDMIGGYEFDADAIIFAVDNSDVNKSFVTDVSGLNETNTYGGSLIAGYNYNKCTYYVGVFDAFTIDRTIDEPEEDAETLTEAKLAYVLTAAETEGGVDAGTVKFKILTSDQGIIVVEANSTFKYVKADGESVESRITYLASETEAFYSADGRATAADRLVKYQLTADNKLRNIIAFNNTERVILNDSAKYDANLGTIGGYEFKDNAVIFAVDNSDVNQSYVTDASKLDETKTYGGSLLAGYNEDENTYSTGVFSAYMFDVENENLPEDDVETLTEAKLAYVLTAAETEGGVDAGTVQFKLLTSDQGIIVVEANSTFKYVKADGESVESRITYLASEAEAFYSADGRATAADRLVKYQLTANNKLRNIIAYDNTKTLADAKYSEELCMIGEYELENDTVIFAVDYSDINQSYATDLSELDEIKNYYGALLAGYDADKNTYSTGVFDCAMLRGIASKQGIAIVSDVAITTYKGEEAYKVWVKVDNNDTPVVLYFDDYTCKFVGSQWFDDLTPGSVLLYKAKADGYVTDFVVLATMDYKRLSVDASAVTSSAVTIGANGIMYNYVWGYVDKFKSGKVYLMDGGVYRADGNMYTYECNGRNHIITAGDYMAADTVGNYEVDEYGVETANFVFMKLANTKVTDIYVIGNRSVLPSESTGEDEFWGELITEE